MAATPVEPTRGRLRPPGLAEVRILDGFWGIRQRANAGGVRSHQYADADVSTRLRAGRRARSEPMTVRLVPYHRWARRGPTTMRVWLPTSDRRS